MAAAGKRVVAGSGPRLGEAGKFEGDFKIQKKAPFIDHRLKIWDRLYKQHQERLTAKPRKEIKIELPDGKIFSGKSWETTPFEIAQGISKALADQAMVAKVTYTEPIESLKEVVAADGDESDNEEADEQSAAQTVLWDLTRPLEGNCQLQLLKFDHDLGKDTFFHSCAHILGQAMEREYGCHLTIGPAVAQGFYYDGYFGDKRLKEEEFSVIEKHAKDISKEAQPFERCVLSKAEALELFSENPFKVQLITNKVPDDAMTSCYRCGPLIDLCRGPHLPNTSKAKEFKINKNSAAYWLGNQNNDSLQRLYGVAFPNEKLMKEWEKFQQEAAQRDHRNVGKQQELFMFHSIYSPGSCFWFPHGTRIYNKLIDLIRREYHLRGYSEVITPNMYNAALFKISGHYQNYREDMYSLNVEKEEWMLKPMNCPGHFTMFDARVRSYKELPMRYGDFGVLHRNEASGALTGLTRVRRFQQDDGHIFVRPEQIQSEVLGGLDFLNFVYGLFGFKASFALSTRPKKALGSKEIWDSAESQLKAALTESGVEWTLNPGDGAFYGPKIDIRLTDAMKRKHQCGTIQLDFNNPIRFNLQYRKEGSDEKDEKAEGEDKAEFVGKVEKDEKGEVIWREGKLKNGFERPVVIHRAILGSVERFTAIITEHFAGKWPFWLSPRQVMVVPVRHNFNEYAKWVERQLLVQGFYVECDLSSQALMNKVKKSQLAQYNYTVVVGEEEVKGLSVNVRKRGVTSPAEQPGSMSLTDFVARLEAEAMPSSKNKEFEPFEGRLPAASAAPAAATAVAPAASQATKGGAAPSQKAESKAAAVGGKPAAGQNGNSKKGGGDVELFLESHPYTKGFKPTRADADLYSELSKNGVPETPNLRRWFEHVDSFTHQERSAWHEA